MHVIILLTETNVSPPSVTNNGTKCAWYLDRTLVNCLKLATLLRVRNSRSLSLRSRVCTMSMMCCLWGHVIQPTVGLASSVMKAVLASMWSSRWTPFTVNFRMWAASKGRSSPYAAAISVVPINKTIDDFRLHPCHPLWWQMHSYTTSKQRVVPAQNPQQTDELVS